MIDLIIVILTSLLALISIAIPLYSLLNKNEKILKNTSLLTYTFLSLAYIVSLLEYLNFTDTSQLYDVGGTFKKGAIALWFIVLVLVLINKNIRKSQIREIKYFSMMTFNLVLAQYVISYYMIIHTKEHTSSLKSPLYIVIIFAIIALSLIAYEWKKKNIE